VDRIFLHPNAQDFLFEYYRPLRIIFNDVLGHLEIDYISIAILNPKKELIFLSSQPSIEQNLIERGLWGNDPCLQFSGFSNNKITIWTEEYNKSDLISLKHYKLEKPKFKFAISNPIQYQNHYVSYSFAVKSEDPFVHINLINDIETLMSIGKFCLQNISKEITLDIPRDFFSKETNYLRLVRN
jgi:hypothetical protein